VEDFARHSVDKRSSLRQHGLTLIWNDILDTMYVDIPISQRCVLDTEDIGRLVSFASAISIMDWYILNSWSSLLKLKYI